MTPSLPFPELSLALPSRFQEPMRTVTEPPMTLVNGTSATAAVLLAVAELWDRR